MNNQEQQPIEEAQDVEEEIIKPGPQGGDDLGIGEFITPEDIAAGKTELAPEQMEQLKRKMAVDLKSSDKRLSREEWNERHREAEVKINFASAEQIREDKEMQNHIKTYLKGKYVKKNENGDWAGIV